MAELALASAGIAAQLFVSALNTYRFVSTAQNLTKEVPVVFWKLRIEQIRFQAWGRFWGLEKGSLDRALEDAGMREDVCKILLQIGELMGDTERLCAKYGLEQGQSGGSSSAEAKKSISLTAKVKYAFNDKAKFESLIDDLKAFNDGLFSLLRLSEYRAVNLLAHSTTLRSVATPESLEDLRLVSARSEDGSVNRRNLQPFYRDLYLGATSKLLVTKQDQTDCVPAGIIQMPRESQGGSESLKQPMSSLSQYARDCPSTDRVIAKFMPASTGDPATTVLVEWKPFDPENPQIRLISTRVASLSRLLSASSPKPADLRVLDCVGYVEDDEYAEPRFGYMFRLPEHVLHTPPETLFNLLARGADAVLPDLGDRFELARTLAAGVIGLHDCGWVHGELDSVNIVFFRYNDLMPTTESHESQPDGSEAANTFAQLPASMGRQAASTTFIDITQPNFLGFTYARPTDPAEVTAEWTANPVPSASRPHSLYRHPSLQGSDLTHTSVPSGQGDSRLLRRQRYDLFSLGLILLEIGLWERLSALWKPKYASSPTGFIRKLLRAYVPRLAHRMGRTYSAVVEGLLGKGQWESDSWVSGLDDAESDWAELVSQLDLCHA